MNRRAVWLWRACSDLAVRIELGFELTLNNDRTVRAIARLPDLGAPKGMLVVASFDAIVDCSEELIAAGYGFSVLNEPPEKDPFDGNALQEMFKDWGWSGELGRKPAWMR